MKLSAPLLAVRDMAASRAFYERVLNEKIVLDFGANITFDGGFSLQTLPTWAKFIDRPPEDVVFGSDFELYFEEENLDAFLEHLEKCPEVELVHAVREYPWGQRVVRFFDPDRHVIEVGESMACVVKRFLRQGMSAEAVVEKTMFPLDFVRNCAKSV